MGYVLFCFCTARGSGIVFKKGDILLVCRHFRHWPRVSVLKFNLLLREEGELLGMSERCVEVMAR